MGYNGYTEKRKASNNKYLSKLIKPTIRMTAEEHQEIQRAADLVGKSFNRYVIDCALDQARNTK